MSEGSERIKASTTAGKDAYAQAMAGIADRKQTGDRAHPVAAPGVERPTPEQIGAFELQPVRTERGQVAGRAYRRQPYFETLAKQPAERDKPEGPRLIGRRGLAALRFYRAIYERGEASATRCALDVDGRGGGRAGSGLPAPLITDHRLHACDAALGVLGETMRMVALHDMTFSDVAVVRYGGREQSRIDVGKGDVPPRHYTVTVPLSGRHREMIRDEFMAGLTNLIDATDRG